MAGAIGGWVGKFRHARKNVGRVCRCEVHDLCLPDKRHSPRRRHFGRYLTSPPIIERGPATFTCTSLAAVFKPGIRTFLFLDDDVTQPVLFQQQKLTFEEHTYHTAITTRHHRTTAPVDDKEQILNPGLSEGGITNDYHGLQL